MCLMERERTIESQPKAYYTAIPDLSFPNHLQNYVHTYWSALFPEGHNDGALHGAGTSWALTGMLSLCLALKHSRAGHDWLHRLELRTSYREALHQGPSAWHRVLDTIKHASQHRLLTASVSVASLCNGSCCMHQLGKSFPPRIPRARGNQFYESTTFTHLDRSMSSQITA